MSSQSYTIATKSYGDDKLILTYEENVKFAGFKTANILTLTFLEFDHVDEDGNRVYNSVMTEYYPSSELIKAVDCFNQRSQAPEIPSDSFGQISHFVERV